MGVVDFIIQPVQGSNLLAERILGSGAL